MNTFIALVLKTLLDKIVVLISDYVQYRIELAKMKKRVKEKVKEIKSDPDRKNRAKRMSDLLSS